jgi:hypothetical protein
MNLYEQSAKAAYTKVAALFDKAAQQFEKCADLIDPDTEPEAVLTLNDAQRKAWGEATIIVNGLATRTLNPLGSPCGPSPSGPRRFAPPYRREVPAPHRSRQWSKRLRRT